MTLFFNEKNRARSARRKKMRVHRLFWDLDFNTARAPQRAAGSARIRMHRSLRSHSALGRRASTAYYLLDELYSVSQLEIHTIPNSIAASLTMINNVCVTYKTDANFE